MRAIIQRVTRASVTVNNAVVGEIGPGLLVLVGVGLRDTPDDVAWLVGKLLAARLFTSAAGRPWGASAATLGLPLLVISQFTLHGSLKKAQPDFHRSAPGGVARELFDSVVAGLRERHGAERVRTGAFGEMMAVDSCNDGPVTLALDSKNRAFAVWDEPREQAEGGGPEEDTASPAPG